MLKVRLKPTAKTPPAAPVRPADLENFNHYDRVKLIIAYANELGFSTTASFRWGDRGHKHIELVLEPTKNAPQNWVGGVTGPDTSGKFRNRPFASFPHLPLDLTAAQPPVKIELKDQRLELTPEKERVFMEILNAAATKSMMSAGRFI